MMINERQDEVIEEFEMFEDWMDKYEYLISLGKELPLIDESKKTEENIIKGCQSRVWLAADLNDSKIQFTADSDAIITKGIISLMIRVLTDSSPKEIMETELYFIDKVGLKEHLSPTRSNGLVSMVKQIKMYAIAYSLKV
ncbi:SufE family protein [Vicingaceae bacterium]|nr:SufE family protein [Vicingaceae bacterium]MDB4083065.1 SufE family protein [Vicingaceae bacterium]MDC1451039.1 SufE family protein [Vicingaceae bacterium]